MATAHGVSRPTLRRALAILEERGRIERQAGRGTFVCDPSAPSDDEGVRLIGIDVRILSEADDYYRRFLDAVQTGLGPLRHRFVILEPSDIEAGPDDGIHALVLMGGAAADAPGVIRTAAGGRPVLCLNRQPTDPRIAFLAVDYRDEAAQATRALLAAGHRSLVYVGRGSGAKAARLAGFRAACSAADASHARIDRDGPLPGFAAQLRALIAERGASALFAEDAATAGQVCTVLAAGAPAVGAAVELLCFDRCERLAADFAVPISEIRMPQRRMGEIGGRWLRARLTGGGDAPPREILPAELLFRSSRVFASTTDRA